MKNRSKLVKQLCGRSFLAIFIMFLSLLWGHALTWFWESPLQYFRSSDVLYNFVVGRDFGMGIYILPILSTMFSTPSPTDKKIIMKSGCLNAAICGLSLAAGVILYYLFLLFVSPSVLSVFTQTEENELLQWHKAYSLLFGSSATLAGGLVISLDLAFHYALAGISLTLLSLTIVLLGVAPWRTYFYTVIMYYLYIWIVTLCKLWPWSPRWLIALPYSVAQHTNLLTQYLRQLLILLINYSVFVWERHMIKERIGLRGDV